MPTPSARPDREITFNVIPVKYIATRAARILIGIEHAIISVDFALRRKTNRMMTASTAPYRRFCNTESTTRSIYTP